MGIYLLAKNHNDFKPRKLQLYERKQLLQPALIIIVLASLPVISYLSLMAFVTATQERVYLFSQRSMHAVSLFSDLICSAIGL